MGRRGIRTAEFVAIILLLIVPVVILITAMANRDIEREYPASCANNLKQLGLALKMYSNESRGGYYPPVGYYRQPVVDCDDPEFPETGDLSQVYTDFVFLPSIYPEYMPHINVVVCPNHEGYRDWVRSVHETFYDEYDKVCLQPNRGVESPLQSFVYFSYATCNDEQRLSPIIEISELTNIGHIADFIDSDDVSFELPVKLPLMYEVIYDNKAKNPDGLSEILNSDIDMTTIYEKDVWEPLFGEVNTQEDESREILRRREHKFFRMQESITRILITEIGWVHGNEMISAEIPLVASRISRDKRRFRHHGPNTGLGGNVLFLDGHVEFVEYAPENFPISPGMALLHESIDASPVFQKRF